MTIVELPPRRSRQSLNGYVRENLERFEKEVSVGVPYDSLAEAALAAGFSRLAPTSPNVRAQSAEDDDLRALRKRFRELVRPPRPDSDEPDPLV